MSGGNNVSDEASRLEQPNDAVAMENMAQSSPPAAPPAGPETTATTTTATTAESTQNKDSSAAAPAPPSSDPTDAAAADTASSKGKDKDTAPPPISKDDRQDSIMAIGPAVDDIKSVSPSGPDSGPVCNITLLLTSGSRHPYKIDAKYLNHRNVNIPEETESGQPDPFSISIYTLKELILREWRSDWEAKPASPSSIRLIHFGKLLDDKEQLKSTSGTDDASANCFLSNHY